MLYVFYLAQRRLRATYEEQQEAVGRTKGQAPEVDGVVHIDGLLPGGVKVGDVIEVTIDAAVGYDFVGTCAGPGGDEA
jgi:hypothetical protein